MKNLLFSILACIIVLGLPQRGSAEPKIEWGWYVPIKGLKSGLNLGIGGRPGPGDYEIKGYQWRRQEDGRAAPKGWRLGPKMSKEWLPEWFINQFRLSRGATGKREGFGTYNEEFPIWNVKLTPSEFENLFPILLLRILKGDK